MPLKPPSFFDDLERMRTPSQLFDPSANFLPLLHELTVSCRTYGYLGISPQNLVEPAPLLKAVVMKDGVEYPEYINPVIVRQSGNRLSYEGCANIYLICDGKRFSTGALVNRPTSITVSYRTRKGKLKQETFRDRAPRSSRAPGFVGVLCHECEHLQGRLIVDISRESLIAGFAAIEQARTPEEKGWVATYLPLVVERDGDGYVLRHGLEYKDSTPPVVSPDALYVPHNLLLGTDMRHLQVPRAGEQLPIKFSEYCMWLWKNL